MADDDDDFDDGIWDAVDQLVEKQQQSKVGTAVSQAPSVAFQQPNSNASVLSNQTKLPVYQQQQQQIQQQLPSWRQPVQQRPLPLAPPAKPASLAQQLGATGPSQLTRPPSAGCQPNFGPGYNGMQQIQQQQNWQQQQQLWGVPPPQQQQQQYRNPLSAQAHGTSAAFAPNAPAGTTAAAAAAAAATHAAVTGSAAPSIWQQTEQQHMGHVQQQQTSMAELQNKLATLEQEKLDLQRRLHQQSQNSIAQHKQNDLLKQVGMLKEQLMFAEQEAKEAKTRLVDKDLRAGQTEEKLKQLQQDASNKEEALRQLQFELDQEKKRAERLAAAAAAASGAIAGSGPQPSRQTPAGLTSPAAAAAAAAAAGSGGVTPSSNTGGRKRRYSGAAAAAATPSAAAERQQVTPPPPPPPPPPQQQQQQQRNTVGHSDSAGVSRVDGQRMEVDLPIAPAVLQPTAGASAAASVVQQHQQQQQAGQHAGSSISGLIPAVQHVRITRPQVRELIWSSCKESLQQLLQPLQAQLLGLQGHLSACCGSSTTANPKQQQQQQHTIGVPSQLEEVLSAVQQQLLFSGSSSSSSSNNATFLLLQLLQLAVVLFPPGGFSEASEPAELKGQDCKWILQPANQDSSSTGGATLTQQQQQRFLVFHAADNAQQAHILPLPLAVAVLQLLLGLVEYDDGCLGLFAAGIGAAHLPGSYEQLCMRRCVRTCSSSGSSACISAVAGSPHNAQAATALQQGGFSRVAAEGCRSSAAAAARVGCMDRLRLTRQLQPSSSAQNAVDAAAVHWGSIEASLNAALSDSTSSAAAAAAAVDESRVSSFNAKRRGLLALLADASTCHIQLLQHAGAVVAALARRLPLLLRPLLLVPPVSGKLLLQLLHARSYSARCHGTALLHELLVCPAAAAAFTAAIENTADGTAGPAAAAAVAAVAAGDGGGTVEDAAAAGAVHPLNKGRSTRSNAATGKSSGAAEGKGQQQQQQQQQQQGSCVEDASAAAAASAVPAAPSITTQAAYDVLLGLLDCSSSGLDEAITHHRSSSVCTNSSSSSSRTITTGRSGFNTQGQWGCFELQRRSCAVVAQLLHSGHVLLLQLLLNQQFTSGYGLAQRLLVIADAACSAAGGDPFCIAAPRATPAAAAAAKLHFSTTSSSCSSSSSASNICGTKYAWQDCLERVRLAQESLLLLRALVVSPGAVGAAAMADLASNTSSLRLIMTTRAKLSEWSDALLAAAAAAAADVPAVFAVDGAAAGARAGTAAAAAALPLAPWAWPYSSHCGFRGKGATTVTAAAAGTSAGAPAAAAGVNHATAQLLKAQRPVLQCCLQELSNSAASVHRRVMIWIKSLESSG